MSTLGKTWTRVWTLEQIAEVRRLRVDGRSASEIAREFNCSRNAIIGLCTRNAIVGRPRKFRATVPKGTKINGYGRSVPKAPAKPAEPPRAVPAPTLAEPAPEPARRGLWEPLSGRKPIPMARLNHFTCRWPIDGAPVLFCGAPAPGIGPYCKVHARMAIRKEQPWRRPRTEAPAVNIRVPEGESA